jgi:MFS family permease
MFLTGFALYLGMDEFMLGVVASMPFMVTIFQLPASYIIGKTGKRKQISCGAAAIARSIWIPILAVSFLPSLWANEKLFIILGMIFISYAFVSISYVSWLSWLSELVPEEMRGRFFGTRNMLCGAAGMIAMVVFGRLLDNLNGHVLRGLPLGFGIIFISAVFFGMVSLRFLNRISEPQQSGRFNHTVTLRSLVILPFKENNFRRFLIYAIAWGFSVNFASPFFTLYFLRDLRFSYSFIAILGMISALADLLAMQLWGRISDRVKNKVVIQASSWVAAFLPLAWVSARPEGAVIPIALHIMGGAFWAGINLCTSNILLRISPQKERPSFIAIYSIMAGLGSAIGPILSGFTLSFLNEFGLSLFSWKVLPIQIIFIGSSLFRLLSLQLFKYVHEPEEMRFGQMVRILRSVRGLNVANGYNYLLHPFVEISGTRREP